MNENRVRFVIEANAANATKVFDQLRDDICNLEKDISSLEAALKDFHLHNAVKKLKEIVPIVKRVPSEVSAGVIFGHIGEEIAGPPGKWFGEAFGMGYGSLLQTTPLQAEYMADYYSQLEKAEAKKIVELSGYKAANDFMPTVTPTKEQVETINAANQAARELAEGDGAVQVANQAARDIAVVTEQASDSLIETREVGLGVYDEWITAQDKWIEEQDRAMRKAVEAGSDFANGWRAGMDSFVVDARNAFRQTEILSTQTARAMQQSFSDFFFDAMQGKLKGFEDYLNSFVISVQRAVADMTAQRVTGSLISGIGGLLSAHGNVFESGQVVPFASGGVVAGPTLFPLGVMGEAGPEAILPLQRTRSGDLGVKAAGQGGGDVVHNYFALNISAMDTRSMSQAFEQHKRQIVGMVQEAYNKRGKRGPVG